MRDLGPLFRTQTGDTQQAFDTPFVRTQVGILKAQMLLGNLAVGTRNVQLPDGSVLRIVVSGGMTRTALYRPQPVTTQPETPEITTTVPEVRVLPVPNAGRLAVGVPWMSVTLEAFFAVIPAEYDGELIDESVFAERRDAWYPVGSSAEPGPAIQALATAGISLDADSMFTAIQTQDSDGQAYLVNQPDSWQTAFTNGVVCEHAIHQSASEITQFLQLFGSGLPATPWGILNLPYVVADTPLQVTGSGGDSSGSTPGAAKSPAPVSGFLLVKKNSYAGYALGGRSGFPVDGAAFVTLDATFSMWVNGVQTYLGNIGTGAGDGLDLSDGLDILITYNTGYTYDGGTPFVHKFNFPMAAVLRALGSKIIVPFNRPDEGFTQQWNAFRYVNTFTVPASVTQSGISTFADGAGNIVNIPCTCTIEAQDYAGHTFFSQNWPTYYTPDGPLSYL